MSGQDDTEEKNWCIIPVRDDDISMVLEEMSLEAAGGVSDSVETSRSTNTRIE